MSLKCHLCQAVVEEEQALTHGGFYRECKLAEAEEVRVIRKSLHNFISFLTMKYWNQTFQYFFEARGILHSTQKIECLSPQTCYIAICHTHKYIYKDWTLMSWLFFVHLWTFGWNISNVSPFVPPLLSRYSIFHPMPAPHYLLTATQKEQDEKLFLPSASQLYGNLFHIFTYLNEN